MFKGKLLLTKQSIFFLILLIILLIPNFFVLSYFQDIKGNTSMSLGYILLSSLVLSFPLIFIKKKTYFSIGLIFLILSPLEVIFVKLLGIPITVGFMSSVFSTNFNEAKEQFISNRALIIALASIGIFYIFILNKIENNYLAKRIRIKILLVFSIFNLLLFFQMYNIQKGEQLTKTEKIRIAFENTYLKYFKIYPLNLLINSYKTLENDRKAKDLNDKLENFIFAAQSLNNKEEKEIYVLVIGETSRFSNYHLNGYQKETSPFLDKTENLLSFQNVYAGANLTLLSLPQIITRTHPHNKNIQYEEKSIVDAFQEAGFYTSWFANQSSEAVIVKRLKNKVDFFKSSNAEVGVKNFLDENILPDFIKIINNNSNKKFIVIHSLGSHFRYTNRYPDNFKKFTPVMEDTGYNNQDINYKNEIINSYDNSILYTDYFLNLLIKNLSQKKQKTVLIYVSDHGENLYDDEKKFLAHGSANPTKYEYHIPFFIWYSKEYEKSNTEKIKNLKNNIYKAISSSTTFYTLLDLANIQYKNSNQESYKSISSPKYQIPEKRFMLNSEEKIIEIK